MLTNEQRAHDLALVATEIYVSIKQNKCSRDLQLAQINPKLLESLDIDSFGESIDVYEIYKDSYDKAIKSFNRDFN